MTVANTKQVGNDGITSATTNIGVHDMGRDLRVISLQESTNRLDSRQSLTVLNHLENTLRTTTCKSNECEVNVSVIVSLNVSLNVR